jgi:hypothetical protein
VRLTSRTRAKPERIPWFKTLRIAILLLILAVVAVSTLLEGYRSTRWRQPLFVAIYPIAADDSPVTQRYIDSLDGESFESIDRFFTRASAQFALATKEPFRPRLQPQLMQLPPQRPEAAGPLGAMLWSLRLRYWAWHASRHAAEPEDVRVFVLYHDPALTPTVTHSLGLARGLIGIVNAFAAPTMTEANNVVIAHELLHTVGATDKYDLGNDAPRFPDGFGDPRQVPLFPQKYAELMAGRRMLSSDRWEQVASLDDVVVGPATALEIRWAHHGE